MFSSTLIAIAAVVLTIALPLTTMIIAASKHSAPAALVSGAAFIGGFVLCMSSPDYMPYLLHCSEMEYGTPASQYLLLAGCLLAAVAGVIETAKLYHGRLNKYK